MDFLFGKDETTVDQVSTQITKDVSKILNETVMNNFTTSVSTNVIEIENCKITGVDMTQGNIVTLNTEAIQAAQSSGELDSTTKNRLHQAAEVTKQNFGASLRTKSETFNSNSTIINDIYSEVATTVQANCFANLLQSNVVNIVGGDRCEITDSTFGQENVVEFISKCTQNAVIENSLFKDIANDVDQTATVTEENTIAGILDAALGPFGMIAMAIIGGVILLIVIVTSMGGGGEKKSGMDPAMLMMMMQSQKQSAMQSPQFQQARRMASQGMARRTG